MIGEEILYSKEDGIGTITINRPEKMNSITDDMLADLTNLLNDIILDTEVRALILTGTGRAFCAGTDLTVGVAGTRTKRIRKGKPKSLKLIFPKPPFPSGPSPSCPSPPLQPLTAPLSEWEPNGAAQCDFRIASEKARFGWVFPKRGIVPDTGAGPYLLPYIVGLSNALDLLYSGDVIDAKKAERIGLVSKVVPPDQLMPAALEMAKRMSAGAPLSLKGIKAVTYGSLEWPYAEQRRQNRIYFRQTTQSEDSKEGVASFFEKRPPVWKGR